MTEGTWHPLVHALTFQCISRVRNLGVEASAGSFPEPSALHRVCCTMECLVPCVKEGLGATISFPDLQPKLAADISSVALSKIISFSALPLCTFFSPSTWLSSAMSPSTVQSSQLTSNQQFTSPDPKQRHVRLCAQSVRSILQLYCMSKQVRTALCLYLESAKECWAVFFGK